MNMHLDAALLLKLYQNTISETTAGLKSLSTSTVLKYMNVEIFS